MYIHFKSKNCVHFFFYLEQTWYKSYLVIDIQEIILNEFKINILLTTLNLDPDVNEQTTMVQY